MKVTGRFSAPDELSSDEEEEFEEIEDEMEEEEEEMEEELEDEDEIEEEPLDLHKRRPISEQDSEIDEEDELGYPPSTFHPSFPHQDDFGPFTPSKNKSLNESTFLHKQLNLHPKKLHLMQSSLLLNEKSPGGSNKTPLSHKTKMSFSAIKFTPSPAKDTEREIIWSPPQPEPFKLNPKKSLISLPSRSIYHRPEFEGLTYNNKADAGLGLGHSFGISHLTSGFIIPQGSQLFVVPHVPPNRPKLISNKYITQKILQLHFESSSVTFDGAVPCWKLNPDNVQIYIKKCYELINQLLKDPAITDIDYVNVLLPHHKLVWGVIIALWGDLHDLIAIQNHSSDQSRKRYAEQILRKNSLTRWLRSTITDLLSQKKQKEIENNLDDIFDCLISRNIEEATNSAMKNKDFRLGTLIAQASSTNQLFQDDLKNQIREWNQVATKNKIKIEDLIDSKKLIIYHLLSGDLDLSLQEIKKKSLKNWLISFGLFLWYTNTKTIGEALELYEKEFTNEKAPEPKPSWLFTSEKGKEKENDEEEEEDEKIFDIIFWLINLWINSKNDEAAKQIMKNVVNVRGYTNRIMDNVLGWNVWSVMRCLDVNGVRISSWDGFSGGREIMWKVSLDLIQQLEMLGLWEWGVYVILNIDNGDRTNEDKTISLKNKKKEIFKILHRNVQELIISNNFNFVFVDKKGKSKIDDDEKIIGKKLENNAKRKFLLDDLKIPEKWIWEIEGIWWKYVGKKNRALHCFVKAQKWKVVQEILVEVAPFKILGGKYLSEFFVVLKQVEEGCALKNVKMVKELELYLRFLVMLDRIEKDSDKEDVEDLLGDYEILINDIRKFLEKQETTIELERKVCWGEISTRLLNCQGKIRRLRGGNEDPLNSSVPVVLSLPLPSNERLNFLNSLLAFTLEKRTK